MKLDAHAVKLFIADGTWKQANLYGEYIKSGQHYTYNRGIITEALAAEVPDTIIIEHIDHVTTEQLKPLIYAAQGTTVSLPVLEEQQRATIGPVGSGATF